jgi:hypothetical protein
VTNTLMQGRAAVTKQVADSATVTLQQAEAAKVAQDRLVRLRQEYQRLGTEVLTKLLPVLEKLVGYLDKFAQWAERHPRLFQAALAGVAAAIIAINVASAATIIGLAGMATGAAGAAGAFAGLAASMAAVVSIAAIWAASFGGGFVAGRALAGEAVKRGLVKPRAGAETWNHDANPFSGENIGRLFGHRDTAAAGAPAAANDDQPRGNRSRADRNNNPGNLRDLAGNYRHFDTIEEGFAAMGHQLLIDFNRHGQHTISQLINDPRHGWSNQWAKGNSAESTANYIASVARALGVGANDQINLNDPNVLSRIMTAMNAFERGGPGHGARGALAAGQHARAAGRGGAAPASTTTVETHIGKVEIHTQATDADGIAHDIGQSLKKVSLATQANTGLG